MLLEPSTNHLHDMAEAECRSMCLFLILSSCSRFSSVGFPHDGSSRLVIYPRFCVFQTCPMSCLLNLKQNVWQKREIFWPERHPPPDCRGHDCRNRLLAFRLRSRGHWKSTHSQVVQRAFSSHQYQRSRTIGPRTKLQNHVPGDHGWKLQSRLLLWYVLTRSLTRVPR